MNNTAILTYLYKPFWGSEQFYKSCNKVGLPVHNAWNLEFYNDRVGSIVYMIYKGLLFLRDKGYEKVIYSDAADTYFVKAFEPPDYLLISVEKACFPDEALAAEYPPCATPWRYVNAGNWCGPIQSAIDFFETNGLHLHQEEHINGQREWHHAYLNSIDKITPGKLLHKFNVHLDTKCEYMQSIAFEDPDDFQIITNRKMEEWPKVTNGESYILNRKTGTSPCVFHGNGRTPMDWIYNLYQ